MQTYIVELRLTLEVRASSMGTAAGEAAKDLRRAILNSSSYLIRDGKLQAYAWEPPALSTRR